MAPLYLTRKDDSVAPSEAEVRAAVAAVEDPDLRRAWGSWAWSAPSGSSAGRLSVVLAMPVAKWPAADERSTGVVEQSSRVCRGAGEVAGRASPS